MNPKLRRLAFRPWGKLRRKKPTSYFSASEFGAILSEGWGKVDVKNRTAWKLKLDRFDALKKLARGSAQAKTITGGSIVAVIPCLCCEESVHDCFPFPSIVNPHGTK